MQAPEPQHNGTKNQQHEGAGKRSDQADARRSAQPQPTSRTRGRAPLPPVFYVAVTVAVIAVLVACFFAFRSCTPASDGRDPNAALGQLEGKTQEEIQAELDRVVEEGMFNISIASSVEFADGQAEGELRIENVPNNPYLMKVEITRDDTGETVYSSGVIEPNHHIQSAKLSVDLDPGSYPCTATFYAHNPETEELVGQAAATLTISVLN